jgi:sulfite reductase alpha subunit-like flavoprotein
MARGLNRNFNSSALMMRFTRQQLGACHHRCYLSTLRVVFGSQTGQAAFFASQLAEQAQGRKWDVVLEELDAGWCDYGCGCVVVWLTFSKVDLPQLVAREDPIVCVCSVFGEGVPPDNAKKFVSSLVDTPNTVRGRGPYSVFGLGDSRYAMDRFNIVGRTIDAKLHELGKTRLLDFMPGDAGNDVEHDFELWSARLFQVLGDGDATTKEQPSDCVTIVDRNTPISYYGSVDTSSHSADNPYSLRCTSVKSALPCVSSWNSRPCMEIWLEHPDLHYTTGDYLGVYPKSAPSHVDEIVALAKLDPADMFSLKGFQSALAARRKTFPNPVSVQQFLSSHCDLSHPLPSSSARRMLNFMDKGDRETVERALADRQGLYKELFWYKSVGAALAQFPSLQLDLHRLVEILQPSKAPFYSISSSSLVDPHRIRLVVGLNRFGPPANALALGGACSSFLTERLRAGDDVDAFVKSSNYGLPASASSPIIMVGVGSGIAPFIGFMEERIQSASMGKNLLFYGCMRRDWDLLYRDCLEGWVRAGVLDCSIAYSHQDPSCMVFAQHLMEQRADEIWQLLENGACLYVCGHTRLGDGVDAFLKSLCIRKCGDAVKGKAYYDALYEQSRYKADVFA